MKWGVQQTPADRRNAVLALHASRRAAGYCIYDRRDRGGPAHEAPVKGGRCQACWERKIESAARKRKERESES